MALSQVLGVSSVALISQAVGRKDSAEASLVFNQSLVLAGLCSGMFQGLGNTRPAMLSSGLRLFIQ
jgi:Na+-driven multidrug efflux pump